MPVRLPFCLHGARPLSRAWSIAGVRVARGTTSARPSPPTRGPAHEARSPSCTVTFGVRQGRSLLPAPSRLTQATLMQSPLPALLHAAWRVARTLSPAPQHCVCCTSQPSSALQPASSTHVPHLHNPRVQSACDPPPQGDSCDHNAVEAALKAAFEAADEEIVGEARAKGKRYGTTAVCALRLGDSVYVAHAGDSRAVSG